MKKKLSLSNQWLAHRLILFIALFWTLFYNLAFFKNLLEIYPVNFNNIAFLSSIAVLLFAVNLLVLILFNLPYILKPVLMILFPVSALASYFMDTYNIIIDTAMVENIFSTNMNESSDLFSFKLLTYFLILGIFPSWLIFKSKIEYRGIKFHLLTNLKLFVLVIILFGLQILLFSKTDSGFVREHKVARYYANPMTYIYSLIKYVRIKSSSSSHDLMIIGKDAKIYDQDVDRELIIIVVGETARADHFSINGYHKQTTPLLQKEQVFSFTNVLSCGTSTAVSVPCMFSVYGRDDYKDQNAINTENLLDVLSHADINILWRDNNSNSKGVANRVPYEDFRSPDNNTLCDIECRDEGMLVGLQDYINKQKKGDILIVLHQMGNHGPAYYKRYPKTFERFTPVCRTSELQTCSNEEINNAYDNAILYTDHFLSKVITLLKKNDDNFETAMLYTSDHGESLGENNMYLHGLPYLFAPDTQKQVPAIMWFGKSFVQGELDLPGLRQTLNTEYNHDHIFHTTLGLFEIKSEVYRPELDILSKFRKET